MKYNENQLLITKLIIFHKFNSNGKLITKY